MDISMESFHTGGTKRGALLRASSPTELRSLTVWRGEDGLHRIDATVTHPGDVRDWTACSITTAHGTRAAHRPHPTTLVVDGAEHPIPADTLPSCAAPVVLAQMLAGCHTEEEFHELDATRPSAAPCAAHFSVDNPEPVDLPERGACELGSVVHYRDGQPCERHWFDSHEIVASQWADSRSSHVDSPDELLEGLDEDVARAVREFIARATPAVCAEPATSTR